MGECTWVATNELCLWRRLCVVSRFVCVCVCMWQNTDYDLKYKMIHSRCSQLLMNSIMAAHGGRNKNHTSCVLTTKRCCCVSNERAPDITIRNRSALKVPVTAAISDGLLAHCGVRAPWQKSSLTCQPTICSSSSRTFAGAACQRNGHILKRNLYRSVSVAPGSRRYRFDRFIRAFDASILHNGNWWRLSGPNFRWRTVITHEIMRCLRVICLAIYGHLSTRRTFVMPCVLGIRFRGQLVAIRPTC